MLGVGNPKSITINLIEQTIITGNQQEWPAKLLGFDFEVGLENKVAELKTIIFLSNLAAES